MKKPISEKRLAANRANAQKSTGPKSVDGKINSSRNGIKHGLLAKTILIDGESRARFQEIFDELCDEYQPTTASERALIDKAAVYQWRLLRAWMLDSASFRHAIRNQTPAEAQLDLPIRYLMAARSVNDNSRQSEFISRDERRFDLHHHRALRDLLHLKSVKAAEIIARAGQTHQSDENKQSDPPHQTHQNPLETQ